MHVVVGEQAYVLIQKYVNIEYLYIVLTIYMDCTLSLSFSFYFCITESMEGRDSREQRSKILIGLFNVIKELCFSRLF